MLLKDYKNIHPVQSILGDLSLAFTSPSLRRSLSFYHSSVHFPLGSGGGVVVKLFAGIRGLVTWISEIGYLLLPSRYTTERST